jgi:hypothetical protein
MDVIVAQRAPNCRACKPALLWCIPIPQCHLQHMYVQDAMLELYKGVRYLFWSDFMP